MGLSSAQQWQAAGAERINLDHYRAAGTLARALAEDAEGAYGSLSEANRFIAMRMFQVLTDIDSSGRKIRRRADLQALAGVCGADVTVIRQIMRVFREKDRNFVLLDEESGLADISHESLIRQWQRLDGWVEQEQEWGRRFVNLAEEAEKYLEDETTFCQGIRLQEMERWLEDARPNPAWAARYAGQYETALAYIDKSRSMEAEVERQQQLNRKREKLVRVGTRVALGVVSALVIALGFMVAGLVRESRKARAQTLEANYNLARAYEEKANRYLEAAGDDHRTDDYQRAWLYAAAALSQKIPADKKVLQTGTAGAFLAGAGVKQGYRTVWESPVPFVHMGDVNCTAYSPDGRHIVSGSDDNTIRIWDMELYHTFILPSGRPTPVFFAFVEATEFYWGLSVDGLDIVSNRVRTIKPVDGYNFVYDPKFRPLLSPPPPGQTKFGQILAWAKVIKKVSGAGP